MDEKTLAGASLAIDYRLTGVGWAACSVTGSEASCRVTASYLSDSLFDLVLAATAVLSGFTHLTFSFEEEPGEYRWVITSSRLNEIQLEILAFEDFYDKSRDPEGVRIFQTLCSPEAFAIAVQIAAQEVLRSHGEAGYRERWVEYPFPTTQLAELNRLLSDYS